MSAQRKPYGHRRLHIEALEQRECPTVTFGFENGILKVTGDQGPNRVLLYQPRDLVMEVEGDGVRRVFEGVREVQLTLLGGHDEAHSSKPKEIVVVGSKIKINAGAGNDTIIIDDGGQTETPTLHNASMFLDVDLGTGRDEFQANIQHHDDVDLNLKSSDGNDAILIGMLLPAVQKVREAAARVNHQSQLSGDQVSYNFTDIKYEFRNVENVDLSLHSPSRAVRSVHDVTLKLEQDSPNLPSHWNVNMNLGAGPDVVSIDAKKQHTDFLWSPTTLKTNLKLGAGSDRVMMNFQDIDTVNEFIDSGDGDDVLEGNGSRVCSGCTYKSTVHYNTGAGSDIVNLYAQGIDEVFANIDAGSGNDRLNLRYDNMAGADRRDPLLAFNFKVTLGKGSDSLDLQTEGYARIKSHILTGPSRDGRDLIKQQHTLRAGGRMVEYDRAMDFGRDQAKFRSIGYQVLSRVGQTSILDDLIAE